MPRSAAGSLGPAFAAARPVGLAVSPACALALDARLPNALSRTSSSSVIFWEETAPVKLTARHGPAPRSRGSRLDSQTPGGGISLEAPRRPGPPVRSLPPILRAGDRMPMSGYSEGSWGLSVLPQVSGIFTGATTSPGSTSRQRPDRYTIRAGRNLPDKEFRYLRTVIVTADIHRGFASALRLAADASA